MCPKQNKFLHFKKYILNSCFAKLQKFRQHFDFMFSEILRNSRKISQNTILKMLQKFRKITKTKIFAATPTEDMRQKT